MLAALVAGLTTAGAALGAGGPVAHQESDHAGSGLASRHVAPMRAARPAGLPGLDVSSWQGNVDWATVAANGARFAFVKATEGTSYVNPYFTQQYVGAFDVGLVRAGLSLRSARPVDRRRAGAVVRGARGTWSADGRTLPGALDIEYNPYGATCYGLSQSAMVTWLTSFVSQYQALTSRWPVITRRVLVADVHRQAPRASRDRPALDRMLVPDGRPASCRLEQLRVLAMVEPARRLPGDQDVFNGSQDDLVALANGAQPPPPASPASATTAAPPPPAVRSAAFRV